MCHAIERYAAAVRLVLMGCGEDPCAVRVLMPGLTTDNGGHVASPMVKVDNTGVQLYPEFIRVKGHSIGLAGVCNHGLLHAVGGDTAVYHG